MWKKPRIVEKCGFKHKMYPLFHILKVENFLHTLSVFHDCKGGQLYKFWIHGGMWASRPTVPADFAECRVADPYGLCG